MGENLKALLMALCLSIFVVQSFALATIPTSESESPPIRMGTLKKVLASPQVDITLGIRIFRALKSNNSEINTFIKVYLKEKFRLEKKTVSQSWLTFQPECIPYLSLEESKEDLLELLNDDPYLYENLNLSQKLDFEIVQKSYFHPDADPYLQNTIFQYSNKATQYHLLIYNGLHLEFVAPKLKDNLKWVYRATLQNTDAVYYASERIKRLYAKTGLKKLKSSYNYLRFLEFKLLEKRMIFTEALFAIWQKVELVFIQKIARPIHWILGNDDYLSTINFLDTENSITPEVSSLDIINLVVSDPEIIKRLQTALNAQLLDARLLTQNNLAKALLVKSTFLPNNFEFHHLVILDNQRLISFPLLTQKLNNDYLFRPGDKGVFDPYKLTIKSLERKSLGFKLILDWESDSGVLTTMFTENKKGPVRENLFYQAYFDDALL